MTFPEPIPSVEPFPQNRFPNTVSPCVGSSLVFGVPHSLTASRSRFAEKMLSRPLPTRAMR